MIVGDDGRSFLHHGAQRARVDEQVGFALLTTLQQFTEPYGQTGDVHGSEILQFWKYAVIQSKDLERVVKISKYLSLLFLRMGPELADVQVCSRQQTCPVLLVTGSSMFIRLYVLSPGQQ
jgi:hypothetical protein